MSTALAGFRTALTPAWAKNTLWARARAVPSLDLRFADNKSLVDATSGQNLVSFTRASSGTYVDSQGVIRTATTNLLLQSADISNVYWVKAETTVTANATTAPDGTTTAGKLIESINNSQHTLASAAISWAGNTQYTATFFAKAGERSKFDILLGTAANWVNSERVATFDLASGTVFFSPNSPAVASITPFANNWFRCRVTATTTATPSASSVFIRMCDNAGLASYQGIANYGLYLWGAQLEQSSTVGEYIPTTSTINSAPRFDHAITSSTTNLCLRSEAISTSPWTYNGTETCVPSTLTDPAGGLSAFKINTPGAGQFDRWQQAITVTNGATYTLSAWVRSTSATALFRLRFAGGVTSADLTATTTWQRFSFTLTAATTSGSFAFNAPSSGAATEIHVWGAQLEQSSTVGAYVPTTTAAATSNTTESLGLLVEESRTNSIRNNTMIGAAAGTPGTLPTNWIGAGSSGLAREVVGTGTESGIAYVDVRYFGTTTSALYQNVAFEVSNQIAAAQSSIWTSTAFVKLVGGSLTNITAVRLVIDNYNSSNVALGQYAIGTFVPTTAALITQRYSVSSTSSTFSNAATAFVRPYLQFEANSGVAIDITLRIGMPQLEQGAFATSVIPTSTAAATRSADVASISGSNFSSWYRQDEGTVFAEARLTRQASVAGTALLGIETGSTNTEAIYMHYRGSGLTAATMHDNSTLQADFTPYGSAVAANTTIKQAFGVKLNDSNAAGGGIIGALDTNCTLPTPTLMQIGTSSAAGNYLNGTLRRITYWSQRLPDSVLASITQ